MAYSTEDTSLIFPTYNSGKNPFSLASYRYTDVVLEGIPLCRVLEGHSAARTQNANRDRQFEDVIKSIQSELNEISEESSGEDVKSWCQKCSPVKLELDIDRLLRFAICRNAIEVVKYLVEERHVDLNRQDNTGRSASMYAMRDYPNDLMLKYIASKVPPLPTILDHRGQSLFYYAALFGSLDALEFLMDLGPEERPRHDASTDVTLPRSGILPNRPQGFRSFQASWYVRSLVEYRKIIGVLPNIFVWDLHVVKAGSSQCSTSLRGIHKRTDEIRPRGGFFWAHLRWVNYVLRRYEKYLGFSIIYHVDWLPSLFKQPLKVPANPDVAYIDPVYESSFKFEFESLKKTPRTFIIFPCLVLQSRGDQKKARISIQDIKKKMQSQPARNMLQSELTLDEAYFPSLPTDILNERNKQQVVSQQCDTTLDGRETDENTEPMLMVFQLWLWRCGHYILTAMPEADPERHRRSGEWQPVKLPPSPGIQTGTIIARLISEFGNQQTNAQLCSRDADVVRPQTEIEKETKFTLKIADVREELAIISQVLEQQLEILGDLIEDFESYNPDSHSFLNPEFLQAGGRLNKEAIKKWEVDVEAMEEWEEVKYSKIMIRKYQKRVKKIGEDAARVEKIIQDQLNLKRTHASIKDARASLTLGTAGLILSTAVIGFTLITIVFAPLAFVTALFALPIDTLLRNQVLFKRAEDDAQPTTAYPTSYVGTWFGKLFSLLIYFPLYPRTAAELLSLLFTVLLVILCVWLLRGTKSFSMLQGNDSGARQDEKATAVGGDNVDRVPSQEVTGLRRRVRRLFGRDPTQSAPSTV
ncbi:hypothetical protein GGR51DRAFT_570887 [Nemania sp. FL0031]|nr:hypothetical protein GGR51DRAFT_570887 [Nemania sp. FL0031]